MATNDVNALLLEGQAYINPFDPMTRTFTGFEPMLEINKLSLKPNAELKEQTSRAKGKYGQVRASVALAQPADFGMTILDITSKTLALQLMGVVVNTTPTTAQTITDEDVTLVVDKYAPLAHADLAATAVTVTKTGVVDTLVEGTDFEVNRVFGWIRPIEGGLLAAGGEVKVSYGTLAKSAPLIRGATQASLRCQINFEGRNLVDGRDLTVKFWDVMITPNSELDLMADDFASLELTGRMQTPTGKDEPFVLRWG